MNSFKAFEQSAWERKAARYNDTWGKVTSQVTDRVLELAHVGNGMRLLDCGCGPGHLSHRATQLGATVVGCDYSPAMVQVAKSNYPDVAFVVEDAEELSFSEATFEAVVMNYLLLHVADQRKVLSEAKRVLTQGGQFVYTMWIPPIDSPGLRLIFEPLKEYADMTVIPPAEDIFLFGDSKFAKDFLLENGFSKVTSEVFPTAWNVGSGQELFEAVQAGTRMGGLVELQSEDVKIKIRDSIIEKIEQFKVPGGYSVPTPSLIIAATKG